MRSCMAQTVFRTVLLLTVYCTVSLAQLTYIDCNYASRTVAWSALIASYGLPTPPNDDTVISVSLAFLDFYNLNELAGTIESSVVMSYRWTDNRLNMGCKHDPIDFNFDLMEKIWLAPMTINAVAGEALATPEELIYVKVFTGGTVMVSRTVQTKVKCRMSFSYFPFDEFYCDYAVIPTLYSNLNVEWDNLIEEQVSLSEEFSVLASHSAGRYEISTKEIYSGAGSRTTLNIARLHFSRYVLHYVMQAYIPNTLTVFLAWMSFSIEPTSIPARVTLNISALIAMVLQYGNVVKGIPKVGYLKSIDLWMLGCVIFIFVSLCEFTVLANLMRNSDDKAEQVKSKIDKIDKWARIIYPIVFLLFALIYFCVSAID